MKQRIISILFVLLLTLSACAPTQNAAGSNGTEEGGLTIVATTYPVYLFASAVVDGVDGVTVERLNTGETSCLHDYTLSVDDMKKIEGADVIAMNGAGLEDFMDDALAASEAFVIDCSEGVELLFTLEHSHEHEEEEEGHDHDHGDYDPHIWMDPDNAIIMVGNLAQGLSQADPEHEEVYQNNGLAAVSLLGAWDDGIADTLHTLQENGEEATVAGLITFHDGFQYFAKAYDIPLLAAIEEEAGSEASAKEILEIIQLVEEYDLPIIFTEVNGSDSTANAIARETGCQVGQLTMLMDGPDNQLSNYFDGLLGNMEAIVNGFAGREIVQ